jgi:hypothetical protein
MTRNTEYFDDLPRTETAEEAEALCDRLMEHTGDLVSLLDRETSLLQRGTPHEITALQARKSALSKALTQDLTVFRQDSEFIRTTVPERLDAMKEQHLQLQKSLTANQDALTAIKSVTENLLHTVAAKVGEQSTGPEVYGKDAGLIGKPALGPSAISVDETL